LHDRFRHRLRRHYPPLSRRREFQNAGGDSRMEGSRSRSRQRYVGLDRKPAHQSSAL